MFFCCSWTTYLEQLTCQSAGQRSQLHRILKTTENFHVSDGLCMEYRDFFLSRVSILTRDIDIAILSVRLSGIL